MAIVKPTLHRFFCHVALHYPIKTLTKLSRVNFNVKRTLANATTNIVKEDAIVEKQPNSDDMLSPKARSIIQKLISELDEDVKETALLHKGALLKKCYASKRQPFYVLGRNPIEFLVKKLNSDVKDTARVFIIGHPGPGRLVDAVLEAGAQNALIYEPNKEFYARFEKLEQTFPKTLRAESTTPNTVLGNIPPRDHITGQVTPPTLPRSLESNFDKATLIIPTSDQYLLRSLLLLLIDRKILATESNLDCYFFLPGILYAKLTSVPEDGSRHYRAMFVLWQLFFKVELLEIFHVKQFLPYVVCNVGNNRGIKDDFIYLAKCTPIVRDANELRPEQYHLLALFVRNFMAKPSTCFIGALEKWAPGIGIELIKNNHGVFTQFRTLTPAQILEVFRTFVGLHECTDSAYWQALTDAELISEDLGEKEKK